MCDWSCGGPRATRVVAELRRIALGGLVLLGVLACLPGVSAQNIIVNQLNDINLGAWPGFEDMQGTEPHCVGRDTPNFSATRRFRLRLRGSSNDGAFTITNGTDTIDYTQEYRDNVNSTAWSQLRPNRNFRFFAPIGSFASSASTSRNSGSRCAKRT